MGWSSSLLAPRTALIIKPHSLQTTTVYLWFSYHYKLCQCEDAKASLHVMLLYNIILSILYLILLSRRQTLTREVFNVLRQRI